MGWGSVLRLRGCVERGRRRDSSTVALERKEEQRRSSGAVRLLQQMSRSGSGTKESTEGNFHEERAQERERRRR